MFFSTKRNINMDPILSLIEVGDLYHVKQTGSKQQNLFDSIQHKIISGLWQNNSKLPSTRALASTLNLSRNTVINTYEQLVAEGYIISKASSGYFVSVQLPETFYSANTPKPAFVTHIETAKINNAFAPGVPDLVQFPHRTWQKLLQRHVTRQASLETIMCKAFPNYGMH